MFSARLPVRAITRTRMVLSGMSSWSMTPRIFLSWASFPITVRVLLMKSASMTGCSTPLVSGNIGASFVATSVASTWSR